MNEEVLRVLKMVEEGKIDSEKAAELIEALKDGSESCVMQNQSANNDGKMLKIRVLSSDSDKVNVQLPINFIKGVLAACKKVPLNIKGIENVDTEMLLNAIDSGITGKIVDVNSGDGDIVEIVIE